MFILCLRYQINFLADVNRKCLFMRKINATDSWHWRRPNTMNVGIVIWCCAQPKNKIDTHTFNSLRFVQWHYHVRWKKKWEKKFQICYVHSYRPLSGIVTILSFSRCRHATQKKTIWIFIQLTALVASSQPYASSVSNL